MGRLVKLSDTLTPDLRRKAAAVSNKRPLLTAMGRSIVSLTKRSFTEPGLRPGTWKARKDDKPHALLQKSTTLRKSIRITGYGSDSVTVGSDRKYATVHQLGSKKKGIEARPFFPFKRKRISRRGNTALLRAVRSYLSARGIN